MSARILGLCIATLLVLIPLAVRADVSSVVGPGDTLKITVLGEQDQTRDIVVDEGGKISLPLAKDIQVAGLTTTDAAAAIAQRLSKFIKNPDVTVELTKKALLQVTVAGQVKTPGVYQIERGTRLMQVIGQAGGFIENADTSSVTVTKRGTPKPLSCNMTSFLTGGDEAANALLDNGDVISVPERNPSVGTVFVYGAVKAPGQPITIYSGMKVSQAISAAGGVLPDQADSTRAILKRGGQGDAVQVDLAKALAGDATADILIQNGDVITVPNMEQNGTFTIYGAVSKAGEFPLKTNMTVAKALANAAVTEQAKVTDVRVTRTDKNGRTQAIKVNVKNVSEGRAADVALQPGDTIYVPQQPPKTDATRWLAIGASVLAVLIGR